MLSRGGSKGRQATVFAPRFDAVLAKETVPALATSGVGLILAGVALESVEGWEVVQKYPTLLALLPMLLGLKCNLEMTLASRLGTAYHVGSLSPTSETERRHIFEANMGVVQVQSIVVGIASGLVTFLWASLTEPHAFSLHGLLFLLVSSILTAWLDALLLGHLTGTILALSRRHNLNPDNISGPIVSALGDLLAIVILGVNATWADRFFSSTMLLLSLAAILGYLLPRAFRMAGVHPPTARVLRDGWTPLLLALGFSSLAGFFLKSGAATLEAARVTVLCPLMNGLGGNIGGIFSARQASSLHKRGTKETLFRSEATLLAITPPIHLAFLLVIGLVLGRFEMIAPAFLTLYLAGAAVQVVVLLLFADWLSSRAWKAGLDPDNHVVPYLTSLGDAIGTTVLVACAHIAT